MAPRKNKLKAVFFDFGDTLVQGRPAYLRRITELLCDFGFPCEYEGVISAFNKADYLLYLDSRAGRLSGDNEYLMAFLNRFAECLNVQIDWESLLPQLLRGFDERSYKRILTDGTLETLEGLRHKGYRLGVISNNDGRCKQKCDLMGIGEFFEVIVDSALEGVRKPAPKIFEIALKRMDVPADEAAHVGDMYGSDVLGARDVNIRPIWYNQHRITAFNDFQPEHDVERLDEILEFL